MFDEIDQENMPRVLADLHVSQCNGPKDSFAISDVHVHVQCFKIDSSTCGNLIPLSLYLELFPHSCVNDLKSTIDRRVQLVAYNKNLIKQYGTCYLKIKSGGHVHICKFYVVDSHFNPIIGVGSCLKLGLIQFQNPVYTGWSYDRPVSIGGHVDAVGTSARCYCSQVSGVGLFSLLFLLQLCQRFLLLWLCSNVLRLLGNVVRVP